MSIQTRNITVNIFDTDGSPVENARVIISLIGLGNEPGGSVAPGSKEQRTDANGQTVFELWENNGIYSNTYYEVKSWHPETGIAIHRREKFLVPDHDAELHNLISDELTSIDITQGLVDVVVAAKNEALSAANQAENSSGLARDYMEQSSGFAEYAALSSESAASSAASAENHSSHAYLSETSAANSAISSAESADMAEKWASEGEDIVVYGGKYSAKHYAAKAERDLNRGYMPNLLVNGHLRFDSYHDPNVTVHSLPLQRDIVADAVLYGWGGDPYEVNSAVQNILTIEHDISPIDCTGKAIKFKVSAAGPIDSTGNNRYHHHFRLICPPERLKEIADNGGGYFKFKVKSNHAGVYSISALNWYRSRGFVREFTVSDDGQWHDVLMWFPIDSTEISNVGWLTEPTSTGDGFGISFRVCLGIRSDSPYLASSTNQWIAGNIVGSAVSDFGSNISNEISFADFRFGLSEFVPAKDYYSDLHEVRTYCYGHTSNDNSRSTSCQVNTGWIAEFNFNPGINFRKTPVMIFILGQYLTDWRVQDLYGSTMRVDNSKILLSALPITRNPVLRYAYSPGAGVVGPNYKAELRIPVASYISSGINLSGPGQFSIRITPYLLNTVSLNGNYASQSEFLSAIAAIPGVESATVSGNDLVIRSSYAGVDSYVHLSEFTIPNGSGGVIDLLDVTKIYNWPPMRSLQGTFNLNLQMIRGAVMGESAGRKPLFYWDATP